MPNTYSGNANAASGTDLTLITLISSTTRRPAIVEFILACGATPADLTAIYHLERFTAVGTEGSGFTPFPTDPASPAAACDFGCGAFSVEPTYTASAIMLKVAVHQRATINWKALPGRQLVAPATANNGIGLQCQSSGGTAAYCATMIVEE